MSKSKDKRTGNPPKRNESNHSNLDGLVGNTQQAHLRIAQKTVTYIFHSPVPPPEEVAKFNQVISDGGNRMMAMAEKEQDHRHSQERADVDDARRGMNYAFIIATLTILGGFVTINMGHEVSGSIFAGGGLAAVIGLFIHGRNYSKGNKQRPENGSQDGNPPAKV